MIRRDKKRAILIATVLLTVVLLAATVPASAIPIGGCIEVNKTVYNPETGEWAKALIANMNDTLQFKCTIHNCGTVNLSQIRFWDVLDCSLKYRPFLKIDGIWINITDDEGPDYRFKPTVLHPDTDWNLSEPWLSNFTELCPNVGTHRQIVSWEDTDSDHNVSACDQIQLTNIPEKWYHVDRVPYTLNLSIVNMTIGNATRYFDSVLNWNEVDLANLNGTEWFQVCSCKDRYTLIDWQDRINDSEFGPGDLLNMRNERTGSVVLCIVDQALQKDLLVSREYELNDYFLAGVVVLEQGETITVEYNATVVRCGVDNNTFQAKGSYDKSWYYSTEDKVTIKVPCQSGDAVDATGFVKRVYRAGEPVFARGSGFLPLKYVDIYITPARVWKANDSIANLSIFGPGNTTTDANGSIGPLLVWKNPYPGEWQLVFDDPDGVFNPLTDAVTDFSVTEAVPLVTPLGIAALIGLLSIVAMSTMAAKKRR
jgi:uncharacterized repeat protein (TIGR01451 family)